MPRRPSTPPSSANPAPEPAAKPEATPEAAAAPEPPAAPILVRAPLLPLSRSNLRQHYYRRHHEDQEIQAQLLPLFLAARPREPLTACRLEVRFSFPDRQRRDLDNYMSGLKPWLDAAVAAGLLAEDRWECLHTIAVTAGLRRGQPETILSFHPEPLPPDALAPLPNPEAPPAQTPAPAQETANPAAAANPKEKSRRSRAGS